MALIEITVDHPSLISTGEDEQRATDEDGGVLPGDEDDQHESGESTSTDDGLGDTLKTVSTILTAVTTIAGVLKRLRENEGTVEDEAESLFDEEDTADAGEEEAESFVESVVGDESDEADADETEELEAEAEDEETDADDSGRGLGVKVAFVLVVVLIALALRARGGDETADEDALDDGWD